jgi:small-conductance mechanosensitive channel
MATLIKDQKQVTFQVGERVQFQIRDGKAWGDNYSPIYKTVYGTVSKMNKISVRIKGVDGNEYIATVKEVKKYIDPFA